MQSIVVSIINISNTAVITLVAPEADEMHQKEKKGGEEKQAEEPAHK